MKKIIISILLISFFFVSFSQDKEWQNKNYLGFNLTGIKSNINLIYNDTSKFLDMADPSRTSISAGISFKNFSEKVGILNIGISIDLNYIEKGGFIEFNLDVDSVKTENALFKYIPSYIELKPLMSLGLGKKWFQLNFLAGPHFSYLIQDKLGIQSESNSNIYKTKADNKFDFGLDFGSGFNLEFGKNNFELRLMYSFGLTDIFNPEEINVDLWYNQNRVMSAQLYYYYKL